MNSWVSSEIVSSILDSRFSMLDARGRVVVSRSPRRDEGGEGAMGNLEYRIFNDEGDLR